MLTQSHRRTFVLILMLLVLSGGLHAASTPQATAGELGRKAPTDGSRDVDQVVAHPPERILAAAKQAVAVYGCDVKKERSGSFECTRRRQVGVLVGSGGEKVTVKVTAKDGGSRVVIKTGKGFVGRLGKKNWSTPIFNELLRLLDE
jgi:hypothetical protein